MKALLLQEGGAHIFYSINGSKLRTTLKGRTPKKWHNCPFLTDFYPKKVT